LRWLDTAESWQWMIDCWRRIFESAGVDSADRVFFPFSFGPFLGFWLAFEAAGQMGSLVISGGGMRSPARLRAILDNEVTVLCITPSYAVHLAEVAVSEGIDLRFAKVRKIIVAGEPGGSIPATRALIEKLWTGAQVIDHHGMTEVGPVTYECPLHPGALHIMEAAFFAEIIHPETCERVELGQTGELVLTNLGRVGSPLLRYRTGDIVRRAEAVSCACGSSELAIQGGILARSDDMVIVRGVNVYPSTIEDVMRSCGITEFRVETFVDRSLTEMNITIEADTERDNSAIVIDRVVTALRNALSLRVQVTSAPRGSLPRFEGKSSRWIRR
jgi:phenylacetate-CoA ligase